MDGFKPVVLSPLTGIFDARTSADQQVQGSFAWKQNLQISPDGKLQTANGWSRPYSQYSLVQVGGANCQYKNWDWHNQGTGIAQKDLEVPTLLFSSVSNDGTRRLYMGTKTKLLLLDEIAGTWSVVGSGFGQDGVLSKTSVRWKCAQLQDNLYLTNAFDKVQYTTAGSGTMQEVTSLQTAGEDASGHAVPVTNAVVIVKYSGVVMIMNVVEGGVRRASRIRWSDLNDGTYWGTGTVNPNTGATSISDFQDLDYGERILGAIEHLGYLYVYTDSSVWRCSFTVSGDPNVIPPTLAATLSCQKVYSEPKNKSRCLWYPNTLVSTGEDMFYAGQDAIYRYNLYMAVPERTEWIYRCSNLVFDEGVNGVPIDQTSCASPIMEYWPDSREIYFSWPVPDATFVGQPSCNVVPPVLSSGINLHTLVLNVEWETCDYRDFGSTAYVNFQSNIAEQGQCVQGAMFFGASSTDFCLKQFGVGYAREMFNYTTSKYSSAGYSPILVGEFPLGDFSQDKQIKDFMVDGFFDRDFGNVFTLQIGMSYTQMPINGKINGAANIGQCGVVWKRMKDRPAKCLMLMTPEQYAAKNVIPSYRHNWPFLWRGRFIYYWLSVAQKNGSAPVNGGVTLTRAQVLAIEV